MTEHIETPQEEHVVHEFFLASVIIKGVISVAEVVVGIAVLFIPVSFVVSSALFFLEYLPNLALQNALIQEVARYTTGTAYFVAFYLFSRGIVKAGLIWAMLKRKLIAYPLSLIVMGLLVMYQVYQIAFPPHSLIVFGITVFDLFVMYFIYREWKILERHRIKT